MQNKFRLTSNAFHRETEDEKINPSKIIFLSMEGTDTEKEYISGLNKYKKELGFNSSVLIEPLTRRKQDGSTAPKQVLELLEEYLTLRQEGVDAQIKNLLNSEYSNDIIRNYLSSPSLLDNKIVKEIDLKLEKIGYDLQYKKFLENNKNSDDLFGIVIDKDSWNNIDEIVKYCIEKGYHVFISNPCFELWLLFHWIDVSSLTYDEQLQIKKNEKISQKHTYTSNKLSGIAHHGKTGIGFGTKYLNKINVAIENASKFETNMVNLTTEIGTNWPELISLLKESSI